MANEPDDLAAAITKFAAGHDMTLVPAAPAAESDRAVLLNEAILDLPGFLELARKLGDGAIYLRTGKFGLDPDDNVPARLARYKGKTCELRAAFASAGHGLLHFWEHTAPWYQQWLDSEEDRLLAEDGEYDKSRQAAEQDRARLARELAEVILADPEFRAAATPPARNRRAEQLTPEGTAREVRWDAAALARDMATEQADAAYGAIWDQLGEIAAELAATPGWQQASKAPGRKKAAAQFLASRAGGFPAPGGLRDELYGRALDLAKSHSGSELLL